MISFIFTDIITNFMEKVFCSSIIEKNLQKETIIVFGELKMATKESPFSLKSKLMKNEGKKQSQAKKHMQILWIIFLINEKDIHSIGGSAHS